MLVYLNGNEVEIEPQSLSDFVVKHAACENYAVAVNQEFIPRSSYGDILLEPNDRVELLAPMVGG